MAQAKRSSLSKKKTADSRLYCRNNEEAIPHFHSVLNLTDVVFMSFDIEGRRTTGNSRIDEIGVSIFDTRQLVEKSELISSQQICTRHRVKSFLFGELERAGNKNVGTLIRSLFYIEDIDQSIKSSESPRFEDNPTCIPNKKYRDIVLVGHGIRHDLSMLTEFQVDVQDILPIVDVVNTEDIGQAVFKKGLKLADLLECLGCPHAKLHNAGNDAAFALRAFLALAIKTQWDGPQHSLSRFQEAAFAPVKVVDILNERLAREIAHQRAKHTQDRRDKEQDWADMLENQFSWDVV